MYQLQHATRCCMCCVFGVTAAIGASVKCIFAGIFAFLAGVLSVLSGALIFYKLARSSADGIVTKFGPLAIGVVGVIFGFIILAMCPCVSMGVAFALLFVSACLVINGLFCSLIFLVCCVLGVIAAIGIHIMCIFAGIVLILTGMFILLIETPFCCAFIPQAEYVTRITDKMGPLSIGIVCGILGILQLAMCACISTGFAFLFLLASAALRIREYILLRRARAQGGNLGDPEGGLGVGGGAPGATYPPPTMPAYGGDPMMDRMAAGAARGAVQAMMDKPPTY